MAADVVIRVEGLQEVRAALRRLGDHDLQVALKRANKAAAERVVRDALPNVPVRSGALRASVRALGSQSAGRALAGGARVPYGPAVHWGTGPRPGRKGPHNIRRRPFLLDAAQRNVGAITGEYEAEIRRIANEVFR